MQIFGNMEHVVGSVFPVTKYRAETATHAVASVLGIPNDTTTTPMTSVFIDLPFSKSKARFSARVDLW